MPAIKFCGCSVTNYNSSHGWNGQKSTLTVNVVEDVRSGDFFNPPALGTPTYFSFGDSFYFWGWLKDWRKENSRSGLSLYTLQCEDPRDLLDGCQVIIGNYTGTTYNVPNLLNAYGYYENFAGFGSSAVNDSGMHWHKILLAVQMLTSSSSSPFGGTLKYRGYEYTVDLSGLPSVPSYYRIGGQGSQSLLSMIDQICQDAGCDYFVTLEPGLVYPVIRVHTVSRYAQPPLGTILQITNNNWGGTLKRASNGLNLRNDITTKFIVGGQTNDMYESTGHFPFWGYTAAGVPVQNIVTNIPGLGITNAAYVDATEIAGALGLGATTYFLTEFEMRFALESDGAWTNYVSYETQQLLNFKADLIGPEGLKGALFPIGGQAANANAKVLPDILVKRGPNASDDQQVAQRLVHEFVKKVANNWYGKKYWVPLPFVLSYLDTEDLIVKNSVEVADGGWDETGNILGLSAENRIKFIQQDGRYEPFALYDRTGVDLESASAEDSAIQGNRFYTKISVDKSIYRWPQTGIPHVLITINNPVSVQRVNVGGDLGALGIVFNLDTKQKAWRIFQGKRAWGTFREIASPPRKSPLAVSIPLTSKINTYGPWYLAGASGKVSFEQDATLTPWEYGGETFMALAATARVTQAVTFMQEAETGSIDLVGMPIANLGTTLVSGGPDLTSVQVSNSERDGVASTYQFTTYSDLHLNRFYTGLTDRLRKIGKVQNELKKSALLSLSAAFATKLTKATINLSRFQNLPKWMMANSPMPVIIASAIQDVDMSNKIRTSAALCDPQEVMVGIGGVDSGYTADNELFNNSAAVGLGNLMHPFANNPANTLSNHLPTISIPSSEISGATPLHGDKLNQYRFSNRIYNDYLLGGLGNTASTGTYVIDDQFDWNNVRSVAFSMPMMCAGWGYGLDGQLTPSATPTLDELKVGPLDPLWDNNRKTWSVHDLVFGVTQSICAASGGSASLRIYSNSTTSLSGTSLLTVYNFYGSAVPSNTRVVAGYMPYSNKFMIISADCTT